MAFQFKWPQFDKEFIVDTKQTLTDLLNQGPTPSIIADRIVVTDLSFGSHPPEIEILDIASVSSCYFKASFKICYEGDGFLQLKTKVQANPISETERHHTRHSVSRIGYLAAKTPLIVPLTVCIKEIKLAGILMVDIKHSPEATECNLRFENDPLQSVVISSSFDDFGSARQKVQNIIEGQLRDFLIQDLPKVARELAAKVPPPSPSSPSPLSSSSPIPMTSQLAATTSITSPLHKSSPTISPPCFSMMAQEI
eukprot:TRINITY_DN1955_c0_g1_i1.p1 TRINITY_DN1955_c0_g1~~TRINITY_DN1955_c0_g1_i1.p1  ORF type:complete len:253 (-),score=69.39 TRINITY_DN1955_c0_g1_i1:64-822(-)